MVKAGRDPDSCKVMFVAAPTLAETNEEAQTHYKVRQERKDPAVVLASMGSLVDIDFSKFDLDEPLAGLSQEERSQLREVLSRVPRDVTIVMIEHDMDSALAFAERITLLHYGEVIVEGTRAEVVADPRTKEVYLGE